MNKNLEILEFHKILDMLANLSANDITREKVLAITPNPDLAEARAELEKDKRCFFSCPYSSVLRRSTGFRICGWDCGGQSPVPSFR
mgnify:CR=1 FL=1